MPNRVLAKSNFFSLILTSGVLMMAAAGCEGNHPLEPGAGDKSATAEPNSVAEKPTVDSRQEQSFADAIRPDPPADWQRPPDLTMTGKSVGKLYTDVSTRWNTIKLVNGEGKSISYSAVLETDLGIIEITLRPDLAPNHVRNFVSLSLSGYYDGLVFERAVHAKSQTDPVQEVELIEGGCPLGTGEVGVGSIGYWLKPELSKELHEPGTVGACHGEEPDTAACRFYITLNKASFLDGNFTVFGKVTQGLDIARRIFSLPIRNDPEFPEGDRPEKPVTIKKVTIVAR